MYDYLSAYQLRKQAEAEARLKKMQARIIPAASDADVMRDQLESILLHVEAGLCGCSICDRYVVVREELLDIFQEPVKESMKTKAAGR